MSPTTAELSAPVLLDLQEAADVAPRTVLRWAFVAFAGLSLIGAVTFKGFLEGDSAVHFLMARFAWSEPSNFVNVWGRPVCTLIYFLPAHFGPDAQTAVLATRILSLLMSLGVAAITWRMAKRLNIRWPEIAALFVFAQPFFYMHSFSEMTELPFAFFLTLAFWSYLNRRWFVLAVCTGLLPLCRPEGFAFVMLVAAALIWHRRWWWAPILGIPLAAWSCAGHLISPLHGVPWYLWVKANWPYSSRSAYGSGPIWSILIQLPALTGPLIIPFTVAGALVVLGYFHSDRERSKRPRRAGERPLHGEFWVAAIPLAVLVGHSVLWWQGLMGSNGQVRYLVICTPFWALLAAMGWDWAHDRYARLRPWLTPSAAAFLAFVPLFFYLGYLVWPPGRFADDRIARQVVRWWKSEPEIQRRYPRIVTSLPTVSFHLDKSLFQEKDSADMAQTVRRRTPGTLLIWDPKFGTTNSDINLCVTEKTIKANGWIHVSHLREDDFWTGSFSADVYLSPMDAQGLRSDAIPKTPMNGHRGS